jgi:cytochrome c biogenesis protein CcmG/thiol:disulfide interchange protein DsbE
VTARHARARLVAVAAAAVSRVSARRARARLVAVAAAAFLAGGGSRAAGGPAAPAVPAAGLPSQAGRLLGGGMRAFERQLRALRGTPVVVNQWASWCGPCRFEFAFLAAAARRHQPRVAFLGLDSQDARDAAAAFLRGHPVPYPTFFDPGASLARSVKGGLAWPTTVFLGRDGRVLYTHPGAYASGAQLERDVRRHALG